MRIFLVVASFSVILAAIALPALAADGVDDVAEKLVRQLDRQLELSDKAIQIAAANFSEQTSGLRLPLSHKLNEALTAALTRYGAMVSLHETGEEPLRLIGQYAQSGDALQIAVRLRKMGKSGSSDLAVVSRSIALGKVDPALLRNSLDTLATELVRQLAQAYLDVGSTRFVVVQPTPGIPGQPTLKLGGALKSSLERALAQSEVFGAMAVVSVSGRDVQVISSYIVAEHIRVEASLQDGQGTVLNRAAGSLRKSELSPQHLEMIKERGPDVCIGYEPVSRRAISPQSPTVADLLAELARTLSGVNIHPVPCSTGHDGIRVLSSLSIDKKTMPDGYGLLMGRLRLQVSHNDRQIGALTGTSRQPYSTSISEARSRLVQKMLTPELADQLAAYITGVE